MDNDKLKEVRKAYILARALNIQYAFIREYLNNDLRKACNDAKSKNSFFIKTIDQAFKRKVGDAFIDAEEEEAFKYLEELDKLI